MLISIFHLLNWYNLSMEEGSRQKYSYLPQVNLLLIFLILSMNFYVLAAPIIPKFTLWLHQRRLKSVSGLPYTTQLDTSSPASSSRASIPTDDRVVIPKIALDEHIYEGTSKYLINKGVWARPKTSTPPKGSNTVLVGHRFTYDGPQTFYNLDKLRVNDDIVLYWGGKEFDYSVTGIDIVPPTATEIENPTDQPRLTLYTCTPIWSAKNRLVVYAKLINSGT